MLQTAIDLAVSVTCLLAVTSLRADDASRRPFELHDGDRVVFLGNTLIEREQLSAYWESLFTIAWPDRHITFRNLGWSGDTVWAESRGIFDDPAAGYARMVAQLQELKPTVLFLAYGGNEAYAGKEGLPRFLDQLRTLLADVDALGTRVVFLSPIQQEHMGPPLPDPVEINKHLAVYTDAIREVAEQRGDPFINLYAIHPSGIAGARQFLPHLTDNGVHLTESGYRQTALAISRSLGVPFQRWDKANVQRESADGQLLQQLREAIVEKNLLYFHNWRPQNITYLFLFRKHEQGNNAGEVEEFKQLVGRQEQRIAELRQQWIQASSKSAGQGEK